MSELGAYIKEKRDLRDLSIRRLAEAASISHTEIKRIEDGVRRQPSPQVLRSIATALSVPYEEIMEAAGYLDNQENTLVAAQATSTDDLTEDELAKVNEYIAFIKSQRK
jgi:transcriptional regulator with XRE-family HTH domain